LVVLYQANWLNVLTHAEKTEMLMEWQYTILFILYVLKMAASHSLHVVIERVVVVAGSDNSLHLNQDCKWCTLWHGNRFYQPFKI